MKKIAALLCALLLAAGAISLSACAAGREGGSEPQVQTLTGTATLTWHGHLEFLAVVDVVLEGDVIQSVTVRDGSFITTDAFSGWEPNREAYLEQYVGLTGADITEMKALPPDDANDHHDGGSVEGAVSVVTGASASSTVIAMAVKNAIERYEG